MPDPRHTMRLVPERPAASSSDLASTARSCVRGRCTTGHSRLQTVITTAIFPIYFVKVAAATCRVQRDASSMAREHQCDAHRCRGLAAPRSDHRYKGNKKGFLAFFTVVGASGAAAMFFIHRGDVALASSLFIVALIGGSGCLVFYESLLPHIASPAEMDRVSTAGYALGYLGGGLLAALNLLWIQKPEWFGLPHGPGLSESQATLPARLAFVSVAVWWLLFSIPLFRRVPDRRGSSSPTNRPRPPGPRCTRARGRDAARAASLSQRVRDARRLPALQRRRADDHQMAAAYGTEIGIGQGALIAAFVLVQFVGVRAHLPSVDCVARGAKPAIFAGLLVYVVITVLGYYMRTATDFFVLAILVGTVQGGTQALSRSLFASMIPRTSRASSSGSTASSRSSPASSPTALRHHIAATGASRNAILSVIAFFVVGAVLLYFVNVEGGSARREPVKQGRGTSDEREERAGERRRRKESAALPPPSSFLLPERVCSTAYFGSSPALPCGGSTAT